MWPSCGWLVLDPSVELERTTTWETGAARSDDRARSIHVAVVDLYNEWLGTVLSAPASEAFLELFEQLREPTRVSELQDEFGDAAAAPIAELVRRGFVHGLAAPELVIQQLRDAWLALQPDDSPLEVDLDRDHEGDVAARARGRDVVLRCRAVPDDPTLRSLRERRRAGDPGARSLTIVSATVPTAPTMCALLFELGATLVLPETTWPHPAGAPPLATLHAQRVATLIELHTTWSQLTEDAARQCAAWIVEHRIGGLRLRTGADAASPPQDLAPLERALRILEDAVGDFGVIGFPTDHVITGQRIAPADPGRLDPVTRSLRVRYLRRRSQEIRALEDMVGPPPSSHADALLVDPATDVIPNDPSLLALRPGAIVADICCAAGRTTRRLAPHVAPNGQIIGIEKELLSIQIGRAIAAAEGVTNIQFRPGLAQRLPLADATVDAVVCDWSFNLFLEIGIADAALAEMTRILRPGGRLAIMQVLSLFQYDDLPSAVIYGAPQGINVTRGIDDAFARRSDLAIVLQKFWLNENRTTGHPTRWYRHAFVPRLVDPAAGANVGPGRRGMLCYSVVAERR